MHQSYRGAGSWGGRGGGRGRGRGRGRGSDKTSDPLHFPKHLNFAIRENNWISEFEKIYGAKVKMDEKEGKIYCWTTNKSATQAIQNRINECKKKDEQNCKTFIEGLERVDTLECLSSSKSPVSLEAEIVSSYSFVYPDTNLIYVPGYVRTFKRPNQKTLKLEKRIDKAKEPEKETLKSDETFLHPLDCMIIAAKVVQEKNFNYHYVSDRNSLRKLFDWVCGAPKRWRINIGKGNNVLFLHRFDLEEDEASKQRYNHAMAFEDKCCEPMSNGKPDNHSYRAVLRVTLGSLKLFVRGEVDAVTHLKQEEDTADPAAPFSKLSLSSESLPSAVPVNWEGSNVGFLKTTESFPHRHQLEEVKTSRQKSFENTMRWGESSLMTSTWFQSALFGVKSILYGLKHPDDESLIVDIQDLPLSKILEKSSINGKEEEMLSEFHNWMRKIYDTFLDPQYAEGKHYAIVFEPNDQSLSIFEIKNPSSEIPLVPACWATN